MRCFYIFYIFLWVGVDFDLHGQLYLQQNRLDSPRALQYLNYKADQLYPVTSLKNKARIVIVPNSKHEGAQCLIAATYKALQDQSFDTIILVCQAKTISFHGVALPCLVNSVSLFRGALVQLDALAKLSQHRLFHYYQSPFNGDSGMQWQCAFLNSLSKVSIIPLVIGQIAKNDASEIAEMLSSCCTPKTLIILSADIAHYENCLYDCPLDTTKACKIYDQDACKIQSIQSGSLHQQVSIFNHADTSSAFSLLFELLKLSSFNNLESSFVGYAASCFDPSVMTESVSFEKSVENVESYSAFIFQKSELGFKNNIGSYEQKQLLQYARIGLDGVFEAPVQRLPFMVSYEMLQPHGVFASLYVMSDHGTILRGCMGNVRSKLPLYNMVSQMTKQAASKDVRFYPLRQKELVNTIVSLSVVTDLNNINRQYSIIKESDGLLLEYDDRVSVSLPSQVDVHDWNYESALVNLSKQVSSRSSLWKKPRAKIFTFQSLVFQEE